MTNEIIIYTDGSSLGNPGPGGWGVIILIPNQNDDKSKVKSQKSKVIEIGGCEANTTNNRMELMAVIEALKYLSVRSDLVGDTEVIIHADSTYVLGGVTSWIANWEKNGWKTANKKPVLNKDLWQELIALARESKGILKWQKVKGHSGLEHNELADQIATSCAGMQKKHHK